MLQGDLDTGSVLEAGCQWLRRLPFRALRAPAQPPFCSADAITMARVGAAREEEGPVAAF